MVFVDSDAACTVGAWPFGGSARPGPGTLKPRPWWLVDHLAANCVLRTALQAGQCDKGTVCTLFILYLCIVPDDAGDTRWPTLNRQHCKPAGLRMPLPSLGAHPALPQHFAVPPLSQCWMNACDWQKMQARVWRCLRCRVLYFETLAYDHGAGCVAGGVQQIPLAQPRLRCPEQAAQPWPVLAVAAAFPSFAGVFDSVMAAHRMSVRLTDSCFRAGMHDAVG